MECEFSRAKLDTYLDGELPEGEMRTFDRHIRSCLSCSAEALTRTQLSRSIQAAGRAYQPSADFQRRIQQTVTPGRRFLSVNLRSGWMLAVAAGIVLAFGLLLSTFMRTKKANEQTFSEIADLHVATLASSSPVDVVSTDRHTVKPWFQGKIPFAFNLPELQNTGFTLVGGRMAYLDQVPGAHLIYDIGKHHVSVFIFQDRAVPASLAPGTLQPKGLSYNMETWSEGGLRYFVISDAGSADVDRLARLFKS